MVWFNLFRQPVTKNPVFFFQITDIIGQFPVSRLGNQGKERMEQLDHRDGRLLRYLKRETQDCAMFLYRTVNSVAARFRRSASLSRRFEVDRTQTSPELPNLFAKSQSGEVLPNSLWDITGTVFRKRGYEAKRGNHSLCLFRRVSFSRHLNHRIAKQATRWMEFNFRYC